jgi:phosphatidylglycerophosphatase C
VASAVVFDLDKVLLSGDASTLFLRGLLHRSPRRLLRLLLAAPLLLPGSLIPQVRPVAARLMTRIAVGGRSGSDVEAVAAAYADALSRRPEAAIADAIACVRAHQRNGDVVVIATGCEETLARGFLAAAGLADLDVVGSQATMPVRRAMGASKVDMLAGRGYPPPWTVVYSDSPSDLPMFARTPRPVLVNADAKAAEQVARSLGRRPETRTWR